MKSISKVIKDNYYLNPKKLSDDYNNALDNNKTLKKIVSKLKLSDDYLMKYTSKLEECAQQADNCIKCKGLE